jgi:hypothetical protein
MSGKWLDQACLSIVDDESDPQVPALSVNTVACFLMTGIRSEKCIVRLFRGRANVIECTYTILDSIAYYTSSLLLLGYKPVQHVTVLNIVGNCNAIVFITILYYNLTGPASYMWSVDQNVIMRRMTVLSHHR